MTDSLSEYLAGELVDWLANDVDFDVSPGTLYVTVEDDMGDDLSERFPNAPVGVGSSSWSRSGTQFENSTNVNLGEVTEDTSNISTVSIYDGSDPDTDTLLLTTPITGGPFDVSDGTQVIFEEGDITYDAVEAGAE